MKKAIEIKIGEPEAPVSKKEAKLKLQAVIDAYKIKNPKKYEKKKAALEAQLNSL